MPEYLRLKDKTWQVRVPVPKALWGVMGKRALVRTTGTGDLQEARHRRFAIIAELKQEIEAARHADPATKTWLELQATALRKSVQRGELDQQVALDMIGQLRDKHLKARGLVDTAPYSDTSIEERLPAHEVQRLASVSRLAFDVDFAPLSGLIDEYLEEKRPVLRPSTVDGKQRILTAFSEWVGPDTDINDVSRKVTGRYVSQILAGNGRHVKTNQDAITNLSTFWNWCIRRGSYEHANPWTGLGQTLSASKRGSSKKKLRAWTPEELKTMFETIPSGPKYWLREMSVIALYTGMRQNEIAELEVTDIDLVAGTIHVSEAKTQTSVRDVPVHSKLLPVIEQIIDGRTKGYLFENFKPTGGDKKRNHEFSKRFGYWRNQTFADTLYVINDRGHKRSVVNFHSFRRSFITACEMAGIPEPTTEQIVGHTRTGMSYGTYSKGVDLKLLRDAIEKVDFKGVIIS